ncbi:MAG: L-lactate permease [Actinomycetes bacterium]
MFQQVDDPVGGSLALSALVAALPLLTLFVLLGALRWKAWQAGLASLIVALAVAIFAFGMPAGQALLAASEGAAFGLFPIIWIVLTAIWIFRLTELTGYDLVLRRSFGSLSADQRIQAIIIAFCFGALLEALAGFGAPVAITGVMLMAIGFSALRAASVVLLANTAPVAFGAIAIPIITAGNLTGIPYQEIGAYVGRQTPWLAMFVPLLLVLLVDGARGVRETWPVALGVGLVFAVVQFVSSNYVSVELTDIIASLVALGAAVLILRVYQPRGGDEATRRLHDERDRDRLTPVAAGGGPGGATATAVAAEEKTIVERPTHLNTGRIMMALLPYLIVIVIFSLAKLWDPLNTFLTGRDIKIPWPGLDGHVLNLAGKPSTTTVYNFQWLSSPGTLLLISGILTAAAYRVSAGKAIRQLGRTAHQLRFAFLTVASVLALAYVMNLSGQTITIGTWIAGAGAAFAFLSPILGWLGTAVTGSDTSANALFATLQKTAATQAGIDPTLMVAANTAGGVVGKMVSPQNLTIAATACGIVGRESDIFRRVILWSLGLLVVLCILIGLQSTVLSWMLP